MVGIGVREIFSLARAVLSTARCLEFYELWTDLMRFLENLGAQDGPYELAQRYMGARTTLCAPRTIYARWNDLMRSQNNICALERPYALPEQYMRSETNLCALRTIYAR